MKQLLKRSLERLPGPLPLLTVEAVQYLRHPHVRSRKRLQHRVIRRIDRPAMVAQGPFRGMRYVSLSFGSAWLPKLLGTYECELSPAVESICQARCDRILDIGAAEGYYAVGMALRNPGAQLVGFELSRAARSVLRKLARCNGVSGRIKLLGRCTPERLRATLAGAARPAVICDCEGAEDELLRPDRVPPWAARSSWSRSMTGWSPASRDGSRSGSPPRTRSGSLRVANGAAKISRRATTCRPRRPPRRCTRTAATPGGSS